MQRYDHLATGDVVNADILKTYESMVDKDQHFHVLIVSIQASCMGEYILRSYLSDLEGKSNLCIWKSGSVVLNLMSSSNESEN